jgi:hypothetical protein
MTRETWRWYCNTVTSCPPRKILKGQPSTSQKRTVSCGRSPVSSSQLYIEKFHLRSGGNAIGQRIPTSGPYIRINDVSLNTLASVREDRWFTIFMSTHRPCLGRSLLHKRIQCCRKSSQAIMVLYKLNCARVLVANIQNF